MTMRGAVSCLIALVVAGATAGAGPAFAAPPGVPPSGVGGQVVAWGTDTSGETEVPASLDGKTVIAVAAGSQGALALTSDGSVTGWGDAYGITEVPSSLTGKTVTRIALGEVGNAMALTSDGKVTIWGEDFMGELNPPPQLASQTVVAIAAGSDFDVAVTDTGQVYVWGFNLKPTVPQQVQKAKVRDVAAGGFTVLVRTSTGTVMDFDLNGLQPVPAALSGKTVTGLVTSGCDSFALVSGGSFVWWGANPPPESLNSEDVVAFAAACTHNLALTADGAITGWGDDADGELDPPASFTGHPATAVSASPQFSLALTPDPGDYVAPLITPRTRYIHTAPTSRDGAVVHYDTPTALDDHDGPVPVTCSGPPSGSVLPRGTTTITCSATDAAGNTRHATITIVVRDISVHAGVTEVSPARGSPAGGNTVVLTGYGFTDASQVRFGDTPAPSFTVDSDTQITVTAPAHDAGFVHVYVRTPHGNSGSSFANRYHYKTA